MLITRRHVLRAAYRCAGAVALLAIGIPACAGPGDRRAQPREGPWMEVHKSFLVLAKKGHIDLLFLGDSITQGWNENTVWQRFYGASTRGQFRHRRRPDPARARGGFRTVSSMASSPRSSSS